MSYTAMTSKEATTLLVAVVEAGRIDMPQPVAEAIRIVVTRLAELETSALPAVDLDALQDPHDGEWGYGPTTWLPRSADPGPAVIGYPLPDPDSDTIYIRKLGWQRDELPGLAGFLLAVHAASDPSKRTCDCGAGVDGLPTNRSAHCLWEVRRDDQLLLARA